MERHLVVCKLVHVAGYKVGGYIYMWTLIFLAIVSINILIVSDIYSAHIKREDERLLLLIGNELRSAIKSYVGNNMGPEVDISKYPTSIEVLLKDPRDPNGKRHLRKLYNDPITKKNDWGQVIVNGRIVCFHSKSLKSTLKKDNFRLDDISFTNQATYDKWVFCHPSNFLSQTSK